MGVLACDHDGPWHSQKRMERSPIYALPALGKDDGERECLTSYLQRLASSHHLFCGDFINHILLPRVSTIVKAQGLRVCKVSHTLNGCGKYANAFELALNEIWPNQSLPKPATFTFLASVLGEMPRGLVSEFIKWCPACLKEQRNELFFPLYWQSSQVTCCTKHKTTLIERCPNCNKGIRQIVSIGILGVCPYCNAKLKDAATLKAQERQLYNSKQVQDLIKHEAKLRKIDTKSNWLSFLKDIAQQSGNISKLEATLGLSDTQISQWIRRSRPELKGLLKLAKSTKTSAYDILRGEPPSNSVTGLENRNNSKHIIQHKRTKQEIDCIRKKIERDIKEGTSDSLKTAATNASISKGFINYHFPDLATVLTTLSTQTTQISKREFDQNLQLAINSEVKDYYDRYKLFPSVNQIKIILSDTPGNSTISLAHLLIAKKSITLRFTPSFKKLPPCLIEDHNHESNNKGDS